MRKFIVHHIPNQLPQVLMANVQYHWELIPKSDPKTTNVVGGGLWHVDPKHEWVYFWHNSLDFGQVTPEVLTKVINLGGLSLRWIDFKVFYSPEIVQDWDKVSKWTELKIEHGRDRCSYR